MEKIQLEMINDFMCPGCIHGVNTSDCSKFEGFSEYGFNICKNWCPSTFMGWVGRIALGLPKGFCRTGMVEFHDKPFVYMRLYEKPEDLPGYDKFNVPVWAMEKENFLFVRCYSPRNNWLFVDVIKDGKLEHAPGAINAGEFYEEMD
jgi:hypothetical protein